MLWMTSSEEGQAATLSSVMSLSSFSSSVTRIPWLNFAPARTSATRWWPVEPPPALLGGVEQLVGHRQRGLLGPGALRHAGAELHGREAALDGVAGAQVPAVFGG